VASAYPTCIGTCLTTEDRSGPGNRIVVGRGGMRWSLSVPS